MEASFIVIFHLKVGVKRISEGWRRMMMPFIKCQNLYPSPLVSLTIPGAMVCFPIDASFEELISVEEEHHDSLTKLLGIDVKPWNTWPPAAESTA